MKARDILKDLVAINTIADKCNHEIMDYIEVEEEVVEEEAIPFQLVEEKSQ